MNGILLIDKPQGGTSMDVCARLRGALHEKRVGHAGTLDPLATGLLCVFLGRATRAVEFAEAAGKTYEAALQLGLTTDTQDVTGTVLSRAGVSVSDGELEAALAQFRGEILQTPPMYSALKVDGQTLYRLARKGKEVERQPRPVTVYALDCLGREGDTVFLRVACSKGTYIRTLCHDIGRVLGCGGTMSALRRTAAGRFTVSEAHALPEVLRAAEAGEAEGLILPLETLFDALPVLRLSSGQERVIRNGGWFTSRAAAGDWRLRGVDGQFLALGRAAEGRVRAVKSFF